MRIAALMTAIVLVVVANNPVTAQSNLFTSLSSLFGSAQTGGIGVPPVSGQTTFGTLLQNLGIGSTAPQSPCLQKMTNLGYSNIVSIITPIINQQLTNCEQTAQAQQNQNNQNGALSALNGLLSGGSSLSSIASSVSATAQANCQLQAQLQTCQMLANQFNNANCDMCLFVKIGLNSQNLPTCACANIPNLGMPGFTLTQGITQTAVNVCIEQLAASNIAPGLIGQLPLGTNIGEQLQC